MVERYVVTNAVEMPTIWIDEDVTILLVVKATRMTVSVETVAKVQEFFV